MNATYIEKRVYKLEGNSDYYESKIEDLTIQLNHLSQKCERHNQVINLLLDHLGVYPETAKLVLKSKNL
jgi:uncharacterized coiled-coil protein SlyX